MKIYTTNDWLKISVIEVCGLSGIEKVTFKNKIGSVWVAHYSFYLNGTSQTTKKCSSDAEVFDEFIHDEDDMEATI